MQKKKPDIAFCIDCFNQLRPAGGFYRTHPAEAVCKANSVMNFVTGQSEHIKCKDINIVGACDKWKKIK